MIGKIVAGALLIGGLMLGNTARAAIVCQQWSINSAGVVTTGSECWEDDTYGGDATGGGDGVGEAGGEPGGVYSGSSAVAPIVILVPALVACSDETADIAANVAFKAYWEANLRPAIAPNNKYYRIYFSNGQHRVYQWTNIISSSYAVTEAGDSQCRS